MMKFAINVILSGLLIALVAGDEENVTTYKTCGEMNSNDVVSVINATVDRLMELRQPTWGWIKTPEVVLGLQLSAQSKFFGRKKAVEQMKAEIESDLDSMSIGNLALYVTAIKSSCQNPRYFGKQNLVAVLGNRMKKQFYYNERPQVEPEDGYYQFGLALGASCVSNRLTPFWLINKILRGQNSDGSFGSLFSVHNAAQILLALQCISTEKRSTVRLNRIEESIEKLVSFLRSRITIDGDNVWIGNKYSSPSSVLGMMKAAGNSSDSWRCKDVMRSLSGKVDPAEFQGGLSKRLPGLAGISYLNLKSREWTCEQEVPIPTDYQPKCDPKNPSSCNRAVPGTEISAISINVRLTIYTERPPNVGTVPNADVIVRIQNGSTLYDALNNARDKNLITFETTRKTWGESMTSMQGVTANKEAREFWSLLYGKTGEFLPLGVSSYIPTDGEQIVFRLKNW